MGITFIYVTHDQEEALTMSDTVVVMDKGRIQQVGSPEDIYNEPKNALWPTSSGSPTSWTVLCWTTAWWNFAAAASPA